ncbi:MULTISPECIES: hypothetical protein [Mycetohabitans]|uniref:hypothetical protein n=1 Tax=Mycetohabitans TaxID=2571159 RepID=UPI00138AE057|nr:MULTISPECIES: hypothetical protein [Mycetohabitans]MCG1046315.1 hypothetical protein [Mycetohabitans sp. B6]
MLANKLDAVSRQIADQKPTGNADLDKTLGNIVANAMSTVAGGVVGGAQGAQAAYNVDRFNRQLDLQEKALAQQLAEKSGGKYSQQQIEDQMRQMSMTDGGPIYAGSPDILIGDQRPTDAQAKWIYGGKTADGNPILTQATVANDTEYIFLCTFFFCGLPCRSSEGRVSCRLVIIFLCVRMSYRATGSATFTVHAAYSSSNFSYVLRCDRLWGIRNGRA